MTELTAMVPLGGREIEMRAPAEGAMIVMARVFKGLPKIENVDELTDEHRDRLIRNLGILGQIVESMIVKDADKDWLDDVMIAGSVTAENVFDAVKVTAEKINGANAAKKPQAAVRRRA